MAGIRVDLYLCDMQPNVARKYGVRLKKHQLKKSSSTSSDTPGTGYSSNVILLIFRC